ncbi:MAG: 50S ribosomal protein L6 [Candidatus Kapabacteria bacterium]|nr:50S ribosomal protein L6 [Candidatus Kapabacteria bacterium]
MSRVGKKPIEVPSNVQVTFTDGVCTVKGPKGELTFSVDQTITPNREGATLTFSRANDDKKVRALHGLTRATIAWMVEGVSNGFTKNLQIEGVGFKVELRGKRLLLNLGYSHPILIIPPDGVEFAVASPTVFSVKGANKHLVGEIAAKVRKLRPPEPYKGKGIRYEGEYIRRKAGKSAGK